MTEQTVYTVARFYREKGVAKVETVLWKHVRGTFDDARGEVVDPGLAARARPLPAEYDPGLVPNKWVWVAAETPAAKLPRPGESVRGTRALPTGEVVDTVDHFHAADAAYWAYYKLPLRTGVELIDEETYQRETAELAKAKADSEAARKADAAAAKAERAAAAKTAREKLAALGLTEAEITALIR